MNRWLSSLPLSVFLFSVWVVLNQSLDAATLLLAAVLAIAVPMLTRSLRPAQARVRNPALLFKLAVRVTVDLVASAFDVARLLLTRRSAAISSRFVQVPLDMRDPSGLAMLAMVLCLTPGTAWAELALDRSTLLIHVFDLDGEDEAFIAMIKQRYERLLMEIFE
ncbi:MULTISPECIES: Na+/H+ antiporter subunit E [unclassified Variovorax]|uniref:Na+/H+ antiporter subunit E n=1 Tax=unclassified Variovorax TaxID=663243 RepID=UPI001BD48E34|nr:MULTISPECIES: Na+/H+ antiporter subunit E [unclassified Variovorax]